MHGIHEDVAGFDRVIGNSWSSSRIELGLHGARDANCTRSLAKVATCYYRISCARQRIPDDDLPESLQHPFLDR